MRLLANVLAGCALLLERQQAEDVVLPTSRPQQWSNAMLDFDRLAAVVVLYGTRFVGAIIIVLVGWALARMAERAMRSSLQRSPHMDPIVTGFLGSAARYAALLVTFLIVIQLIGIQATSLVAVLGAASLAIGLALQGTLSNVAGGVMLLIFRPFHVGDEIEVEGKRGEVVALNLFTTEMVSKDNAQIIMPNGKVWGVPLTNFSTYARATKAAE
jgi:small conductance mechanosensitive channel